MSNMRRLGQVEVLSPKPWYLNETFWMGVTSSLVATAVFWYWIHDVWPVDGVTQKEHDDNVDVE